MNEWSQICNTLAYVHNFINHFMPRMSLTLFMDGLDRYDLVMRVIDVLLLQEATFL